MYEKVGNAMMTKEQEIKFLEFCDNLHKFIIKNGWQGACHASVAMMFAVAKKLGIDAKPCIGECIQKNQELFDHSWLLIDKNIRYSHFDAFRTRVGNWPSIRIN